MLERGISSQCDSADAFFFSSRTLFLSWLQTVVLSEKKTEVKQRERAWTSPAIQCTDKASAVRQRLPTASFDPRNLLIRITAERVFLLADATIPSLPCPHRFTPGLAGHVEMTATSLVLCACFSSSISSCCFFLLFGLQEKLCRFHFFICKHTNHLCSHSQTRVTLTSVRITLWRDLLSPSLCFDWKSPWQLQSRVCKKKKTSVFASLTSFYFPCLTVAAMWFHYEDGIGCRNSDGSRGRKSTVLRTLRDNHEKITVFFPPAGFFFF